MQTCPQCGSQQPEGYAFCRVCGYQMVASTAPAYEQRPPYSQPTGQTYLQPFSRGAKIKAIIGFALGVESLVSAAMALLYGLLFLATPGVDGYTTLLNFIMGIASLPFAIVGYSFCSKAIAAGATTRMARNGKTMSLIAIVLSSAVLLLGVYCLFEIYQ